MARIPAESLAWWLCIAAICVISTFAGGCGVSDFVEDPQGTVYTCGPEEWCSILSAEDLGNLRDQECHETTVADRWWPGLTNLAGHGCDYSCEPHVGCNALDGCYGCGQ